MSKINDVKLFHKKFELSYNGIPRNLDKESSKFRSDFMQEELDEYKESVDKQDLEGQLDALVDLVYVALGTSHLQGFNFDEAWRRVQVANMSKVKASVEDLKTNKKDVVKPSGWIAPDHSDLVTINSRKSIIVEGPDNSGKSTLCKELGEKFNIGPIWSGGPPKSIEDKETRIEKSLSDTRQFNVLDRCFVIGEAIYGSVLRNEPVHGLVDRLNTIRDNSTIIYCKPSIEILSNFKTHVINESDSKDHLQSIMDNYLRIIKEYDSLMDYMGAIVYDYENDSFEDLLKKLL